MAKHDNSAPDHIPSNDESQTPPLRAQTQPDNACRSDTHDISYEPDTCEEADNTRCTGVPEDDEPDTGEDAENTRRTGVPVDDTQAQRTRAPSQRIRKPSRRAQEAMMNDDYDDGDIDDEGERNRSKSKGKRRGTKSKNNVSTCKVMSYPQTHSFLMSQIDEKATAPTFDVPQLTGVESSLTPIIHTLFTQYGVKNGLRIFGKQGDDAVNEEMQQLHNMKIMRPKDSAVLRNKDRRDALQYLMFLKIKRDGRIKGRGCADGRKQRAQAVKGAASSPTI